MRILSLLIILTFEALAIDHCSSAFDLSISKMLGGNRGYGQEITYHYYQKSKNILLLSDSPSHGFSMGERLSSKFPDKKIISSDFDFAGVQNNGNYSKIHIDNTKEMPFADDSFDTIIMRRGMCVCRSGHACGGFCAMSDDAYTFFKRVTKMLDKNNPKSVAILHGEYGTTREVVDHWIKYLEKIETEFPVRATLVYSNADNGHILNSIVIRPLQ